MEPEHVDVAESLNKLGLLYKHKGEVAKAEPLYQRSLDIFEKRLGPEHPQVATLLNNIANLYQIQGDYAKAEHLHQPSGPWVSP